MTTMQKELWPQARAGLEQAHPHARSPTGAWLSVLGPEPLLWHQLWPPFASCWLFSADLDEEKRFKTS